MALVLDPETIQIFSMKVINQLIIASFIFGISSCDLNSRTNNTTVDPVYPTEKPTALVDTHTGKRKIKLAILLDTSGSMDGLIEQAKSQLWKIVTQLAKTKEKDGSDPEIELALYEYGNDDISIAADYIQQVSGFTTELDEISEKLFALQTNGGSEYCGSAIRTSLRELSWSTNKNDLQLLYKKRRTHSISCNSLFSYFILYC